MIEDTKRGPSIIYTRTALKLRQLFIERENLKNHQDKPLRKNCASNAIKRLKRRLKERNRKEERRAVSRATDKTTIQKKSSVCHQSFIQYACCRAVMHVISCKQVLPVIDSFYGLLSLSATVWMRETEILSGVDWLSVSGFFFYPPITIFFIFYAIILIFITFCFGWGLILGLQHFYIVLINYM